MTDVAAHSQSITHNYVVHFPAHPARTSDPHYIDFEHIRKAWKSDAAKWQCAIGKHRNDFSECNNEQPLELHHAHIEFSLQNGIDLKWLEADYPGVSDPNNLGAWVESAANLVVLCQAHHRGSEGAHVASASDYEAEKYVKSLISKARGSSKVQDVASGGALDA